MNTIVVGRK